MKLYILLLSMMLIGTSSATTTAKGVDISGDTLFWIVITIALTLFFAMKGMEKLLLANPVILILLLITLVIIYIIFSAIAIVFGIGDFIDGRISDTVDFITSIRG